MIGWKGSLVALAVAVVVFLAVEYKDAHGAIASSERVALLVAREHRQLRTIRSSTSTLRFFERHADLLYSQRGVRRDRVGRHAWREVRFHRARIGWTRRELGETRAALAALRRPTIPHRAEWLCIRSHETPPPFPSWKTNSGNGYFGGIQMDREFMATYGPEFVRKYGGSIIDGRAVGGEAHLWTPEEQMVAAERAYKTRGFWPWPNTARMCGLL